MEQVRPAYGGPCVASLVPALLGDRTGATWLPRALVDAEQVVLLVLDGLGWRQLQAHRPPALTAMDGGPITTVTPSTTAPALASITTGLAPTEHGLVGYRVRLDGQVVNMLRWTGDGNRQPPPPSEVAGGVKAFGGREVPVVTRSEFYSSAFSKAHMRGARLVGWRTTPQLVRHVLRLVEDGEPFVYAYYDGVDLTAHVLGLSDEYYRDEIAFVDRLAGELIERLPPRATLAITADHGQVEFGRDGWRDLDAVAPMVEAYAGDGRFRYLYARDGAAGELAAAAREHYGDVAWVMTRQELFDQGWLGPAPSDEVARRVGDVILAAHAPVAFADPAQTIETGLVAGHGSLTEDEMLVPLLAAAGEGARMTGGA